jgi:hypothetical protein
VILRVYVSLGDGNNNLKVRFNLFKVLEIYQNATKLFQLLLNFSKTLPAAKSVEFRPSEAADG